MNQVKRMTRSRWTPVAVATSALVLAAPTPALAQGNPVHCGTVLTADTTLTDNLLGCVGDGLVIGADGITVDLAGHLVTGDNLEDPTDMGIRVTGHHDVHVMGGTVQGFFRGIVFDGSPSGVVTAMTVRQMTRRGIVFAGGSNNAQVFGNRVTDNHASGIAIVASDGAHVSDNQSLRNIGGAGVRLEAATDATVTHNALKANSSGVQTQDSAGNRLSDNMIADAEIGFQIDFSSRNVVRHNRVTGTSTGITVGGDSNVITDNQVLHGVDEGIGIQIGGGDHNLVAANTVVDQVRCGVEVDDFGDGVHPPVVGNIVRGNVVDRAVEGICVGTEAGGVVLDTLVEGNRVIGASDDGIQVFGPSTGLATTTISDNDAVHNGDLGIAAMPGVIDGGGNRAAGNGNPLQCLNVSCT
jgi:large repetitive protein